MYYNKLLLLLYITIHILFAGCNDSEVAEEDMTEFNKLEWLQGVWEGTQGDARIYESWRRKNFRIMEGISYTTVDNKRVYSQDMRIEQSNNKIQYIITEVTGEEKEVRLTLSTIDETSAEFINAEEGYPGKIIYSQTQNNRMNVSLLGPEGDEKDKTEFNYRKTNP